MSAIFKLDKNDLLRGLVVAAVSALLSVIVRLIESKGFGLDMADLQMILSTVLLSTLSYLSKNLATDQLGRLGGKLRLH